MLRKVIVFALVTLALWGYANTLRTGCTFNSLCKCDYIDSSIAPGVPIEKSLAVLQNVSCNGVRLLRIPDFPSIKLRSIELIGGGIVSLGPDAFGYAQISDLNLSRNAISRVAKDALIATKASLRSLDMSYNGLFTVPQTISELQVLESLNLQSNKISHTNYIDAGDVKSTLINLLLGDNDLTHLTLDLKYSLSNFLNMESINLDKNYLKILPANGLPFTLKALSASHNLISHFPDQLIINLNDVKWVYLRDNFIQAVSGVAWPPNMRLEVLDLSANQIGNIDAMFTVPAHIKHLNLNDNLIKVVPAMGFKGLQVSWLHLSGNKFESINDRAFIGIGNILEYLEIENNDLAQIPKAILQLKKLKYLYLGGNKINHVPEESFTSLSRTLIYLSLAKNDLEEIPKDSLKPLKFLTHLNLSYNTIKNVKGSDFSSWAGNLATLTLKYNKIKHLDDTSFMGLPRLKELNLSFNRISRMHEKCFSKLSESLEVLEISFGMTFTVFPEKEFSSLKHLKWLALDNNELVNLTRTSITTLTSLEYLNLEGNNIREIPNMFFQPRLHKSIKDFRVSFNKLTVLNPFTFDDLESLENIALNENNIKVIHSGAFRNLKGKLTIILSNNEIQEIQASAFLNIPFLVSLDLHKNRLTEFNVNIFQNVTSASTPLNLNLSYNLIDTVYAFESFNMPIFVNNLDLSHNRLSVVPMELLNTFKRDLHFVDLSYNYITSLEFTEFDDLPHLEELRLSHNKFSVLRPDCFQKLKQLQVLDLSYNHIVQINIEQFKGMRELRHLDLSHNSIRSIPRDAFAHSGLEKIDLHNNKFVELPFAPLVEVGYTLYSLDMSENEIENLDEQSLDGILQLRELNLARNKISYLRKSIFEKLDLIRLDISGNPLGETISKYSHQMFERNQNMMFLNIADTGIKNFSFHLHNLVSFNMSGNGVYELPPDFLAGMTNLRELDVSRNKIAYFNRMRWDRAPYLLSLDASQNPLTVLTKDSFTGLSNLKYLNLQNLPELLRFDSKSLSEMTSLKTLKIQTWPKIEKYRFRLARLLLQLKHLKKLSVIVDEEILSDHLVSSFPNKLELLEITGKKLKVIDKDCFEGLNTNRDVLLRIHDTSVSHFPPKLFSRLSNGKLALDLSNNQLETLEPDAFFDDPKKWRDSGTAVIPGGITVEGNPIRCSCNMAWLGEWQRRHLRESLLLHTMTPESNQRLIEKMKKSMCRKKDDSFVPILTYSDEECPKHNSALTSTPTITLIIVTIYLIIF